MNGELSFADKDYFKQFLSPTSKVSIEEAIFRSEQAFKPANLQDSLKFWEEEVLKEHPQKVTLLKWIQGVKIEDFLKSFTQAEFQGIKLNSYYPTQRLRNRKRPLRATGSHTKKSGSQWWSRCSQ